MKQETINELAKRANTARNAQLSPARKKSIAKKAAKARWKDHKKKTV